MEEAQIIAGAIDKQTMFIFVGMMWMSIILILWRFME